MSAGKKWHLTGRSVRRSNTTVYQSDVARGREESRGREGHADVWKMKLGIMARRMCGEYFSCGACRGINLHLLKSREEEMERGGKEKAEK